MTPEFSPELRAELMDDFYVESEELLGTMRSCLGELEQSLGEAAVGPPVFETLFRCVHSFKGNCAMVALRQPEELAHEMEGFLRQLSRREVTLTVDGLELLIAATQRAGEMVSAHRLKQPAPQAAGLIARLRAYTATATRPVPSPTVAAERSPARGNDVESQMEAAQLRGLTLWRCTFAPSRELDARGININRVRARLAELGEIIASTPSVRSGGSIAFEFILGLRETPSDLAAWETDGMEFLPVETTEVVAALPDEGAHPAPATTASNLFIAPSHIVRVDLSRLDELMQIAGELVVHRSRLEDRINVVTDNAGLREVNLSLGRSLRQLREAITRVRMVRVTETFTRLPFVMRELSVGSSKKARLVIEGEQTEIDKYLVERLKEPMLHLVRNAFSHGLELPQERLAAGKPEQASITLRARSAGEHVVIEIADDGRGIDVTQVIRRAIAAGLPVTENPDEQALLALLCSPGFSTREEADRTSGRGMGMTVVQNTIRELGGSLSLKTETGRGTQFTLRLPLTLSIAKTIIVSAGGQTCAVPQTFVDEVVQCREDQVHLIKQHEVIPYREAVLPVVRLRSLFKVGKSDQPHFCVLVLTTDRGSTGLVVDRVHTQREVVVRPLRDPLLQVPGVSGATELGDGRPVLILDAEAITAGVVRPVAKSSSEKLIDFHARV